MGISKLNFKS